MQSIVPQQGYPKSSSGIFGFRHNEFTGILPKGISVNSHYAQPENTCVLYYSGRDGHLLSKSDLNTLGLRRALEHFQIEKVAFPSREDFQKVLDDFAKYSKARRGSVSTRRSLLLAIKEGIVKAIQAEKENFNLELKRIRKSNKNSTLPIQ